MRILYIIGNGFDLRLGLKTSYSSFYNYYNSLSTTKERVKFLKESISKDFQNWSDLELGLGKFTEQLDDPDAFTEIYEDISDQLATYLENEETSFDYTLIDKQKFYDDITFPEKFLLPADQAIINSFKSSTHHWRISLITLNYTRSIEKIIGENISNSVIGSTPTGFQTITEGVEHLHGYVDDRMIMGVNDVSQIMNSKFHNVQELHEAFIKPACNTASKSNVDKKCAAQIQSADLICIFGCSIGDTDKTWWDLIAVQLRRGAKLIIFTWGNEIDKRRIYKRSEFDRKTKKHFFDRTNLDEMEKQVLGENVFIAHNTDIFSHMRTEG